MMKTGNEIKTVKWAPTMIVVSLEEQGFFFMKEQTYLVASCLEGLAVLK